MTYKVTLTMLDGQTTPRAELFQDHAPKIGKIIFPVLDGHAVQSQVMSVRDDNIEAQEM